MNKMINLMIGAFASLLFVFVSSVSYVPVADAQDSASSMRKRRYRYRKRHHRVQVNGNVIPWSSGTTPLKDRNLTFNVDFLYGYNFGWFEFGPNIGVSKRAPGSTNFKNQIQLGAGLWGDLNLIKNTRKQKVVPAIGLKINYLKEEGGSNQHFLLVGPKLSLKLFPASRTGLVLDLGFDYMTSFQKLFGEHGYGLNVQVGYAHYFN